MTKADVTTESLNLLTVIQSKVQREVVDGMWPVLSRAGAFAHHGDPWS